MPKNKNTPTKEPEPDEAAAAEIAALKAQVATFAGRNLSPAHIDSPAVEQLAIVLAAQRVSNVHTEYGYFGEGARNQDKGLTEGDIRDVCFIR